MVREKMAHFLCELRKEKGLLQNELAEIFIISPQAISKWERGESIPDIETLEKLAKFYNVSIEELLNGERKIIIEKSKEKSLESKLPPRRKIYLLVPIITAILFLILGLVEYVTPARNGINYLGSHNLFEYIFLYHGNAFVMLLLGVLLFFTAITLDFIVAFINKRNFVIETTRNFIIYASLGIFTSVFVFHIFNTEYFYSELGTFIVPLLLLTYLLLCNLLPDYKIKYKTETLKSNIISNQIKTLLISFLLYPILFSPSVFSILYLFISLVFIGVSIAMAIVKEKTSPYVFSIVISGILLILSFFGILDSNVEVSSPSIVVFMIATIIIILYSCVPIFKPKRYKLK